MTRKKPQPHRASRTRPRVRARTAASWTATAALVGTLGSDALAQDQPPAPAQPPPAPPQGGETEGQPAPGPTIIQLPGQPQPPQVITPGYPAPGTDLEGHLP